MSLIDQIKERFITHHQPIPPGVYQYQAPPDADIQYRLHLRVEEDGSGILIVNARTVLHLNQTATEYAYHIIQNTSKEEAADRVARRYRVGRGQAYQDYEDFIERLNALITTPDLDPVTFLGFDRTEPYAGELTAPYRLDCAITYRNPEDEKTDAAPHDRVKRELDLEEWKTIMKKAWDAGIPHIIFTGGEPTLRPDLPDLIRYGEELGQVTGLLTCGYRLSEHAYLNDLLQSGLDHIMHVFDPDDEQAWEALRDALREDIFVTVHLTISKRDGLEPLLDRLVEMGVQSISLSASKPDLKDELNEMRHAVAYRNISLVWDLPVPYSRFNPVSLELAELDEPPVEGAGRAWLYVEPDGDVLISQGKPTVIGNLLTQPWEEIWTKAKAEQ
jgi:organic radical activating enzyme